MKVVVEIRTDGHGANDVAYGPFETPPQAFKAMLDAVWAATGREASECACEIDDDGAQVEGVGTWRIVDVLPDAPVREPEPPAPHPRKTREFETWVEIGADVMWGLVRQAGGEERGWSVSDRDDGRAIVRLPATTNDAMLLSCLMATLVDRVRTYDRPGLLICAKYVRRALSRELGSTRAQADRTWSRLDAATRNRRLPLQRSSMIVLDATLKARAWPARRASLERIATDEMERALRRHDTTVAMAMTAESLGAGADENLLRTSSAARMRVCAVMSRLRPSCPLELTEESCYETAAACAALERLTFELRQDTQRRITR